MDEAREARGSKCDAVFGVASLSNVEVSFLQYLILVVLRDAPKPLHGYAIHKLVEERNEEACVFPRVGQASVYKSLENLLRREMIMPGKTSLGATGRPSREFILTELGRQAIATEANRMQRVLECT